jgi:hypothetical protein
VIGPGAIPVIDHFRHEEALCRLARKQDSQVRNRLVRAVDHAPPGHAERAGPAALVDGGLQRLASGQRRRQARVERVPGAVVSTAWTGSGPRLAPGMPPCHATWRLSG